MSRKKNREEAFKLIYQTEINKEDYQGQLEYYLAESEVGPDAAEYITDLVAGVIQTSPGLETHTSSDTSPLLTCGSPFVIISYAT